MRRLVIGDIHGAHKALRQSFERSVFDFSKDQLIVLAMSVTAIRMSVGVLTNCFEFSNVNM